ncbi:flagellar biosynthetic protein FliR [Magnetococcus marinus MC-1]|uniref:Flagellar biosynthetic protein FliR n=1 Tax=Magnetococcus marinus (strain ATCC BAA-1437 / JCM 17883 / MC-1) TaxID=156889 RepID=A0L3J6_MAGMM|nr:flagellar biosynthetic protein FliR [Magnetococcus marinus]ABK42539.1 flagellar biosynthetic protein FliR [Magnetococcus marinus MC-1]
MDPAAMMDFFGFTIGEVERMVLIMSRLSGLFLAAPFFSRNVGPKRIRVILLLWITIVIYPIVPPWPGEGNGEVIRMVFTGVVEFSMGIMIGMIAHWVLVSVQIAGTMIGFEMGLSMAMVMDPTSGVQEGVLANLLYLFGLMLFLLLNGHHWLLEGLARSFVSMPLGSPLPHGEPMITIVLQGIVHMFELALLLAAPVVAAAKLLYLGMGLINRASPQIQVFFLAMPVAQLMGFLIMGLTLSIFGQRLTREMELFINLAFRVVGLTP